ncbi:TetR/AcrR family transcriptional regulator [Crocinitomix sp.]|nr:TetR/AcrR family transcriptional regulator [Crocinitomix sp.]
MISTRKKIVVIADQLIRSSGYNAFSYADIGSILKIKNAAIHYHFPTKAALGKAVIEETRDKFKHGTDLWAELSINDQLYAFFDLYKKNEKNNCICFMGALGSDYNSLPAEMQEELKIAHDEISAWLTNIFTLGKENGHFNFKETPESMTNFVTSALLATLILQRVSTQHSMKKMCETLLNRIAKKNSYE